VGSSLFLVRAGDKRWVVNLDAAREQLERYGTSFAALLAAGLARLATAEFEPSEQRSLDQIEEFAQRLEARDDMIETRVSGPGGWRTVGEVTKASKNPHDAAMLFLLTRAAKPRLCLELGTNVGISASYQARAQKLNGAGRTVTLEGSPGRCSIAADTFAQLGLDNVELRVGRFEKTLDPALEELGSLDWAFIDGHHQELPTIKYFERISAHIDRPGLILVDDIRWSEGMVSAWNQITVRPDVSLAVDLGRMGLCLFEQRLPL
jgi:predicted O-methyltransferase YrrM